MCAGSPRLASHTHLRLLQGPLCPGAGSTLLSNSACLILLRDESVLAFACCCADRCPGGGGTRTATANLVLLGTEGVFFFRTWDCLWSRLSLLCQRLRLLMLTHDMLTEWNQLGGLIADCWFS